MKLIVDDAILDSERSDKYIDYKMMYFSVITFLGT